MTIGTGWAEGAWEYGSWAPGAWLGWESIIVGRTYIAMPRTRSHTVEPRRGRK